MFNGKNILITGGTGSFGKTYTRILLENFKPNKIIIYSRDELKQYEMSQPLARAHRGSSRVDGAVAQADAVHRRRCGYGASGACITCHG